MCAATLAALALGTSAAIEAHPIQARVATKPAASAATVLRRYEAWRGGDAYRRATSMHAEGGIEDSGLHGTVEIWWSAPGRYRRDAVLGAVRQNVGIDNRMGWNTTLSGQVQRLPAAEIADALRVATLLVAPAFGRGVHANLAGTEVIEGVRAYVLRASGAGGYEANYLIDAAGALRLIRYHVGGRSYTLKLGDWRSVDGVRIPFLQETLGPRSTDRTVVRLASARVGGTIPQSVFRRPLPTAYATFDATGSSGWLPFEFFGGNRIFIDAEIAGRRVPVLLDSGAEASVVDRRFAAEAHLGVSGEVTANGISGTSTAGMIPGVDVRLGGFRMTGLTVAAIDLGEVAKHLGHDLPIVLGAEVFRDSIVDIDFAAHRIAFRDPASFRAPSGSSSIPITASGGLYTVPATIEGRRALLDFDLGSSSPLILFPRFWRGHPAFIRSASTTLIGGVGGMQEAGLATIRGLRLGGTTFTGIPAELRREQADNENGKAADGNIGLPLLSRSRLLVDLPHGRVWFVGRPDNTTSFERNRSGLSVLMDGGTAKVLHVGAGSPAQKAGMKVGDVIATVDGARPDNPSASGWRSRPAGTRTTLGLADGRTIHLILEDYY